MAILRVVLILAMALAFLTFLATIIVHICLWFTGNVRKDWQKKLEEVFPEDANLDK